MTHAGSFRREHNTRKRVSNTHDSDIERSTHDRRKKRTSRSRQPQKHRQPTNTRSTRMERGTELQVHATEEENSGETEPEDTSRAPTPASLIDGVVLASIGQHSFQHADAVCNGRQLLRPPLPLSLQPLTRPDMILGTHLLLPLVDCVYAHSSCLAALASTGTCCVQVPIELLDSVDQHLHVIRKWLVTGCVRDSRPALNCNTGVSVREQTMAFYLSSHYKETKPSPDPNHYTLWATASEYKWSHLLIQPTFRRQQTTYALAVTQSADMNEVMRGHEGSVIDILNRIALVLHADGYIKDAVFGDENGVRQILPMAYFEVGPSSSAAYHSAVYRLQPLTWSPCCFVSLRQHLCLFATPEQLGKTHL